MAAKSIEIGEETGAKRVFVWAVDWPGWCRSGKAAELAREALLAAAPRYALVARLARLDAPSGDLDFRVVESVTGGSGTDFGVPSTVTRHDRRPTTKTQAARLADLVSAAWRRFDTVAAGAPASLRKGPRGGGRDRDKMIDHLIEADHAYAREIGLRLPVPKRGKRAAIEAERAAVLELLRRPSDGSPLNDRKWPARYAARRLAWHALDHAWEMEERSEPG